VKTPGPYSISAGDQGGPLTNGANHSGVIHVGDVDPWTIDVTAGQSLDFSVGEVAGQTDPGFNPWIRVFAPNGAFVVQDQGADVAEVQHLATQTGTYTVLVSNYVRDSQTADASYTLAVMRTAGPYTISNGDQGGPLTNGANH